MCGQRVIGLEIYTRFSKKWRKAGIFLKLLKLPLTVRLVRPVKIFSTTNMQSVLAQALGLRHLLPFCGRYFTKNDSIPGFYSKKFILFGFVRKWRHLNGSRICWDKLRFNSKVSGNEVYFRYKFTYQGAGTHPLQRFDLHFKFNLSMGYTVTEGRRENTKIYH